MKLFRYWVRHEDSVEFPDGAVQSLVTYGYSNVSEEDARANACSQLELIKSMIWGRSPSVPEDYQQPIREEIVRELSAGDVVTCNRYGALVLNATGVIFVDVDFDGFQVARKLSFWQRLFTARLTRKATPEEAVEAVFATARRVLNESYCRIYRTAKGLRLLVVEDLFRVGTPEFGRLMKVFQADRLYARLCVKQECTRARLTPKPSRMGLRGLRHTWPRTGQEEAEVTAWRQEYVERSKSYGVCQFLGEIGVNRGSHQDIIDYHDAMTKAQSGLPLA